jgi:hypothetical protein
MKSLDQSSAFNKFFKKNKKFSVPFINLQTHKLLQEQESSKSPRAINDTKKPKM